MKEPIIRTHNREIDELFERYRRSPGSHVFAPLADAYRKLGLVEEALDICARGLSANPRYASGYVVQGKCQFDAGRADRAEDSFKKVLEIDGDNLVALRYLGMIRAGCGDTDGARGYFEHILVLDPGDKEIQQRLDALRNNGGAFSADTLVDEIEQVLQPTEPAKAPPKAPSVAPAAVKTPSVAPAARQAPSVAAAPPRVEAAAPDEEDAMDLPEVRDEFEGSPILLGDDSVTTEYIATVTLADIFASQGYAAKALKIYRDVLRRQPENEIVRRKIAALEEGEPLPKGAEQRPETPAVPPAAAIVDPTPVPTPPVPAPAAVSTPAGAPIDEGRSYEQFKRWLRTVSD